MNTIYTTKTGKKFTIMYNPEYTDEFFQEEHGKECANHGNSSCTDHRIVQVMYLVKNEKGQFIADKGHFEVVWYNKNGYFLDIDGERIYINDYDYMTLDEFLADYDNLLHAPFFGDMLKAMLIKNKDRVGVVLNMDVNAPDFALMGVTLTLNTDYVSVLAKISDDLVLNEYSYKISFDVDDEKLKNMFRRRTFTFSDFAHALQVGDARIVDKKAYRCDRYCELMMEASRNLGFKEKIKNFVKERINNSENKRTAFQKDLDWFMYVLDI